MYQVLEAGLCMYALHYFLFFNPTLISDVEELLFAFLKTFVSTFCVIGDIA